MMVALAGAALRRHRPATAIATFVAGLGPWWDGFIILGAVYIAVAFWLVAGKQVRK
ncbi:MAG: hypothetical protein H0W70_14540 [Actinobacteria bacterium]|nr:hypothetical protein [Actinomycetota bacterium]